VGVRKVGENAVEEVGSGGGWLRLSSTCAFLILIIEADRPRRHRLVYTITLAL